LLGLLLFISTITTSTSDLGLGIFPFKSIPAQAGRPWFDFRQRHGFFFPHRFPAGSRAHAASYPMGNGVSYCGVKRTERETVYSPPSGVEVKIPSLPIRLHCMVLR